MENLKNEEVRGITESESKEVAGGFGFLNAIDKAAIELGFTIENNFIKPDKYYYNNRRVHRNYAKNLASVYVEQYQGVFERLKESYYAEGNFVYEGQILQEAKAMVKERILASINASIDEFGYITKGGAV